MKRTLLSLLILGVAALTLAQVTPTGRITKTFPPSGATTGSVGSGGPSDLTTGLQAYYHFDGTVNSPVGGASSMGRDEILQHHLSDSAGLPGTFTPGKSGREIEPDASSGQGLFETSSALRQSGDFTVASWMKNNGLSACGSVGFGAQGAPWSMGDGNVGSATADYRVIARDTGGTPPAVIRFEAFDSAAGSVTVQVTPTSTYKFYVMVYTASTKSFKIYTDNVLTTTSSALTNGLRQVGTSFKVQPPHAAASQCKIRLDELMVYNRAISTTEIACLYNGGAGLFYPFAGGCS